MRIIKITEGFVINSSSYSGSILVAVRKCKRLKTLLKNIGSSGEFDSRLVNIKHPEDYEHGNVIFTL